MKIPQMEIDSVYILLNTLRDKLDELGVHDDKTTPLTIISNPFGDFDWLTYHPSLGVGGSCTYYDQHREKEILFLDTVNNQLVWYNREADGEGWHPVTSDRNEFIEEV